VYMGSYTRLGRI